MPETVTNKLAHWELLFSQILIVVLPPVTPVILILLPVTLALATLEFELEEIYGVPPLLLLTET